MPKGQNKTKRKNCGGEQTPTPGSRTRSKSKSNSSSKLTMYEMIMKDMETFVDGYAGISPHERVSPLSPFDGAIREEDKSKYEKYLSFEIIFHLQKELDENTEELPKPDQSLVLGLVTAQNLHNIAWLTNIPLLNRIDLAGLFTDKKQPIGKRMNLLDANNALGIACKHVNKIRETNLLEVINELFVIFEEILMDLFIMQYEQEKPTWLFGGDMEKYIAFELECTTYLNLCIYNYKKDIDEKILSFITDTCK